MERDYALATVSRQAWGMPITIVPAPRLFLLSLCVCAACDSAPNMTTDRSAACVVETDGSFRDDADGIADSVLVRHFNDQGKVDLEELDTNGDGGFDQYTVHLFNPEGQNYRSESYRRSSGLLVSVYERAYDEDGRVVLATGDKNADGAIDSSEVTLYEGRGTISVRRYDDNFDGVFDREDEWHSGPYGLHESWSRWAGVETHSVYKYNEQWLLIQVQEFTDGALTATTDHRYNAVGHKTTSLSTRNGQQSLTTYSHDERGFINGWTYDQGRDGTIEDRAECAFDEEGRMVFEHIDRGDDGSIDYVYETGFDDQGRPLFERDSDDAIDHGERITTYRYDCKN